MSFFNTNVRHQLIQCITANAEPVRVVKLDIWGRRPGLTRDFEQERSEHGLPKPGHNCGECHEASLSVHAHR